MRRTGSRQWVWLSLIAVGLVGMMPAGASAQAEDVLTIGVSGLASSMDVQIACDSVTWSALRMVHDPLLYINEQSEVKPWLAESYRQINPTTWQFKLRTGVKFHNGEPFNAAAVKFSLERFNNPRVCLRTTFQSIKQVDVVSEDTVNVVLAAPDWSIINLLATWADMLPPKAAADMATYGALPIGTGPYVAESWTPGDRLVLRRNDGYWAQRGRYGQVTWRIIREEGTRVAALKAGEVQLINNVPPESIADIRQSGTLEIASVASIRVASIGVIMPKKSPFAEHAKVRQALWYAIDRDSLVKFLLGGQGEAVTDRLVVPEVRYSVKVDAGYKYDPAKAKGLLAEAGFPNGISNCTFGGPVGRYLKDREVGQAVVGQLAKIGINCQLVQRPIGEYLTEFRKGAQSQFDLGFLSLAPSTLDMNFALLIMWADSPYTQYRNEAAHALWVKARQAQSEQERVALYGELQRTYMQDGPAIHLYRQPELDAMRRGVPYKARADEWIVLTDRYALTAR